MSVADQRNMSTITDLTIQVTSQYWNISELKLFKNGENVTFKALLNNKIVYVRVTENSRRSKKQILAELNWVKSISDSGIVVAHPIEDMNSQLTHTFETDSDSFHVAVFANASGVEPSESTLDTLIIAEQLGFTIGKLHRHSSPNLDRFNDRHKWYENIHVIEAENTINNFHSPFTKEWTNCFNWWHELAKSHKLSLVHMDAHSGNFNIDNSGQVCLFDFDDCAWNFLSYDLAVAIDGLQWLTEDKDLEKKIESTFIKSYRSEYDIDQIWIDRIGSFKRLRAIEMLGWSLRMYGVHGDKKRREIDFYNKLFSEAADLI